MQKLNALLVVLLFGLFTSSFAQTILNANGPGNTYELITSVLAPGGDPVENPECVHAAFGRHIAEVWDTELNQYVFEFYSHVTPDNDRCINFDRQRVEIKTYDQSPPNLIGTVGETVTYKWRFRMPVGFQPSPNFTHIHQIKAVGGNEGDPIFTLTARKGNPNKLELIHKDTNKVVIVNQSSFEGVWVECTEVVYIHPTSGTYSMVIKRVSDAAVLLSYSNASLGTIRVDNDFVRPKWGIYRSLLSSSDLRDEAMRFNSFYISEGSATSSPAAPTSLTASAVSASQINLSWADNATNEETYRIERSQNGTTWSFRANALANATSYSDVGLPVGTRFYYRVRAENTFGNSAFTDTAGATTSGTSLTTVGSGNWSSTVPGAPWPGGVLPLATDNVIIADTCVITLDMDATVASLTVGQGLSGTFQTSKTILTNFTINGNLVVNSGAQFKVQSATTSFTGPHTLTITGDITHNGSVFDLRTGSAGSTLGVINASFTGSTNSTVAINTAYSTTNGDFNSVTFNKTGGAKVILGSDIFINGGSSSGPATMNSIVAFVNGIVETGNFTFAALTSTAANVTGASSSSYVIGAMGRGLSNSAGSSKDFPVGDANGYRPFNLRSTTAGGSTGHYAIVRMISGDANAGSIFGSGIDRVSSVRYYKISYNTALAGNPTMNFDRFYPTYGTDDGVVAGNTSLRVAYSTDNRANWNGLGQTTNPHTTDLTNPPTQIRPDSLNPAVTLTSGSNFIFICLANMTGGGNPLPIQLASFTARTVGGSVELRWRTISEINNYGFHVQRRQSGVTEWWTIESSFVAGHGTTNEPHDYAFTDNGTPAGSIQYRLKQVDLDGTIHFTEPIHVSSPTNVNTGKVAPIEFSLKQNYPNPFNPSTEIQFSVEQTAKATLEVFNLIGERVAKLFDGIAENGKYYSATFAPNDLSSGVYLYRLQSGNSVQVKRLVFLK